MSYATVEDVTSGFRELSDDEKKVCETLLSRAAVIIDAYNVKASEDAKKIVSCNMVMRTIGDEQSDLVPVGATQVTNSALGYSQSWTYGSGSAGEMYLSKLDKKLLGVGNRIGAYSPVEGICEEESDD